MLTLKEDTMLGDVPNDWDIRPLRRLLSANFPGTGVRSVGRR